MKAGQHGARHYRHRQLIRPGSSGTGLQVQARGGGRGSGPNPGEVSRRPGDARAAFVLSRLPSGSDQGTTSP